MMVADPRDPAFVFLADRWDSPIFNCALQVSGDGGRRWAPLRPVPDLPAGVEKCYGPEIAFDGSGTLHYLFVGLAGAGNTPVGVFLTASTDRGRSFSPPRQVLGANMFQARMAIDRSLGDGRMYLAWLDVGSDPPLGGLPRKDNPIRVAYSDDGGATFSTPIEVSGRPQGRVVAPALAVGADHSLHVLFYDLGEDARDYQGLEGPAWDGLWSLVLSTSTDGGQHFGAGVVVDAAIAPAERVMLIFTMPPAAIAADATGRVFVAWTDARFGDADVLLRRSDDGGRSWGPALRVNDDPKGNDRAQYLPQMAVAPDGRVDAIFYDRRRDPENVRNDVSFAYSLDNGRSFSPNTRVTSESSDSRIGQRYQVPSAAGQVEFGSRLALLSLRHAAVGAWTDTRMAPGSPHQDIFVTTVDVDPGPGNRGIRFGVIPAIIGALATILLVVFATRVRFARVRTRVHAVRQPDAGLRNRPVARAPTGFALGPREAAGVPKAPKTTFG